MRLGPALAAGGVILAVAASGCVGRDKKLYDDAESLWLNEKYEEAVSKLRLLVDEYPDSAIVSKALFRLGEIYYLNLDDPDKSLGYFERAAEVEETKEAGLKAREYMADIYENATQDYDKAIIQYQKIIHDYKGLVKEDEYVYRIAGAYFKKGDYDQAIIEYTSILERFPGSDLRFDVLYQVASAKLVLGNPEEALGIFRALLEKGGGSRRDYDIRLGVATCYEDMGKLPEALSEYRKMSKLYPGKVLVERKIDSLNKRMSKKLGK